MTRTQHRDPLRVAVEHLQDDFLEVLDPRTIERTVRDSYDQLAALDGSDAERAAFAERFARERLAALALHEEEPVAKVPVVLFASVHNAARSQIAVGWMRHLGGDEVTALSCGSSPVAEVDPAVIEVMAEIGVDVSSQFPKPWTDETLAAADVVVTMGCARDCPVPEHARHLTWDVPVPKDAVDVVALRTVRDEIGTRVRDVLAELGIEIEPQA